MSGLKLFPNRIRPHALVLASAAALLFTGSVGANDKKPSGGSKPAAAAPRATPSRPSAPAGGGHSAPSAGGGHSAPSAGGGHSAPNAGGGRGSMPNAGGGHSAPNAGGGHSAPNAGGGHGNMPNAGGGHSGAPNAGGGRGNMPNAGGGHSGAPNAGGGRGGAPNAGGGRSGGGSMAGGGHGGPNGGGGGRVGGPSSHMGGSHTPASVGHNVRNTPSGHQVAMHGGRPSEIRGRDMMIRRGPAGMRRTTVERGGRVYSFNRAGYGHVRSGYSYGGRNYAVRRYYAGGAYFPRYYASYGYRGVFFDAYAPAYYYSPYYYGWAYRPWAAPVAFGWGWRGSAWAGYYGGYFTPYPVYSSPNLWLTDYIVAQTLEASYRERVDSERAAQIQDNNQPPPQQAAMTPEIKQMIAEEVQRQLAAESAEASRRLPTPGAPPAPPAENSSYTGVGVMLEDNKTHVLLSNANIDVTTEQGQECSINQGDAVAITPGQGGNQGDETVKVKVLASAGRGCPANSIVTVSLQDVQEMINHVRATLDAGLAAMQKDPKLPKPPSTVPVSTTQSEFAAAAPPADPNEAAELTRLNSEATTEEQTVLKEASYNDQNAGAPGTPVQQPAEQPQGSNTELQPGMTPEQVIQMKGTPTGNTKFGAKQILTYPGLKLTFTNGKLSDIQ